MLDRPPGNPKTIIKAKRAKNCKIQPVVGNSPPSRKNKPTKTFDVSDLKDMELIQKPQITPTFPGLVPPRKQRTTDELKTRAASPC